jgi:hypothetical protein
MSLVRAQAVPNLSLIRERTDSSEIKEENDEVTFTVRSNRSVRRISKNTALCKKGIT